MAHVIEGCITEAGNDNADVSPFIRGMLIPARRLENAFVHGGILEDDFS